MSFVPKKNIACARSGRPRAAPVGRADNENYKLAGEVEEADEEQLQLSASQAQPTHRALTEHEARQQFWDNVAESVDHEGTRDSVDSTARLLIDGTNGLPVTSASVIRTSRGRHQT